MPTSVRQNVQSIVETKSHFTSEKLFEIRWRIREDLGKSLFLEDKEYGQIFTIHLANVRSIIFSHQGASLSAYEAES